jgi:hypothetical protein
MASAAAIEIFSGKETGLGDQREKRAPQSTVQSDQPPGRIAHELAHRRQPSVGFLPARWTKRARRGRAAVAVDVGVGRERGGGHRQIISAGMRRGLSAIICSARDTDEILHKRKPQRLAVAAAFDEAFVPASALVDCGHSHWATMILHEPSHLSLAIAFAFSSELPQPAP